MARLRSTREQRGWYVYDWANSGFQATVIAVFFGPYLTEIARNAADGDGYVHPFGIAVRAGSVFPYAVSASVVLAVFVLPWVGGIADRMTRTVSLLAVFAYVGAAATCGLYLVTGTRWVLGVVLFLLANVAYAASVVIYYALLPAITPPDDRDAVSSRGWAVGYLGGGLLLAANLALFLGHDSVGLTSGQAVRISLFSAGVWWAVFTLVPVRVLRHQRTPDLPGDAVASGGLRQMIRTLREMRAYPQTLLFLVAFLLYNDGIQTIISQASVYGSEELGLGQSTLIGSILMVQFLAFGGALALGALAGRIGATRTVLGSLVLWVGVLLLAWVVPAHKPVLFIGLAVLIGFVLGGSQALSRSIFSQLIPGGHEAEYFSLYELSDRGTSWIGPLVFGLVYQGTGSYRIAIVSLLIFFVIGIALLAKCDVRSAILTAGNQPPARV